MGHKGQVVAYLRVSSDTQSLERQEDIKNGADRVFEEVASGGTRERPVLKEMLAYVREGDSIIVYSMDRLARSLADLEAIVKELVDKGVAVRFEKDHLEFIPKKEAGEFDPYAKFQLQMLGAVAELERSIIRARQAEGIAKAKARGAYQGRKPSLAASQVEEAREQVAAGVPKAQVARDLGVSRQTLYRGLAGTLALRQEVKS